MPCQAEQNDSITRCFGVLGAHLREPTRLGGFSHALSTGPVKCVFLVSGLDRAQLLRALAECIDASQLGWITSRGFSSPFC